MKPALGIALACGWLLFGCAKPEAGGDPAGAKEQKAGASPAPAECKESPDCVNGRIVCHRLPNGKLCADAPR